MKKRQRLIIWTLIVVMFSVILNSFISYAEEDEYSEETVRVGFFHSGGFFQGHSGQDDYKSGYGYDYLQDIAIYTDWKYEYVEDEWSVLLNQLRTGEIDLLCDVSKTSGRAKDMFFSAEVMGTENYYVYTINTNKTVLRNNFYSLYGKTIGIMKQSLEYEQFCEWAQENCIRCDIVFCDGIEEQIRGLENGTLDAIVDIDIIADERLVPITKVGSSDFYFAVNKNRPDLFKQLNMAHSKLLSVNPAYNEELRAKYRQNLNQYGDLSNLEKQWLEKNGGIRVGYLKEMKPYCYYNEEREQVDGIIYNFFEQAKFNLNIAQFTIDFVEYETYQEMKQAFNNHEIDCMFPFVNDMWIAEQEALCLTKELLVVPMLVVFQGDFSEDKLNRICVGNDNDLQEPYARIHLSDSEIIPCENIEHCLNAIRDGKADATLLSMYHANDQVPLINRKINDFHAVTLSESIGLAFAVNKEETALLTLLNRAIAQTDRSVISSMLLTYTAQNDRYTFSDFVREHAMLLAVCVTTFFVILVAFIFQRLESVRKDKEQVEEAYNRAKQAQHRAEEAEEEAKRANIAKSDFLSHMSHDIRTPMNGIIGMLDIAEKYIDDKAKVIDCHSKIRIASGHLLSLINDILDMSKLESGKIVFTNEAFDIIDLTEDCYEMASMQALERGISVERKQNISREHSYVIGSPLHVRQILLNLISNGIKYNKPNGSLKIEINEKNILDDKILIQFIISDTGIGMSEDFIKHIYEPFTQEGDDSRSVYKGTGLGMAIVKKLVESMQGIIKIESIKDVGSTFTIELPFMIEENKVELPKVEEKPISIENMQILLVEDNELNMAIAEFMLQDAGAFVKKANNGKEAIEVYLGEEEGFFDIILMDIMMPVMDGLTATKKIRELDRSDAKTIPILAMTANAYAEDVQKAKNAGMNEHLAKPLDTKKMIRVVSKYKK